MPGHATTTPSTSGRRLSTGRSSMRAWTLSVIAFELFDATHAGIGHRYPMAVDWLARRLAR